MALKRWLNWPLTAKREHNAMPKLQLKTKNWQEIQDFQNENSGLLIMVADPRTDEVSISFAGQNTFTRFPMEDMSKGVVFNALRKSKFEQAIDAFMSAIIASTGIDVTNKDGNELLVLLGGAMKALGIGEKTKAKIKKSK